MVGALVELIQSFLYAMGNKAFVKIVAYDHEDKCIGPVDGAGVACKGQIFTHMSTGSPEAVDTRFVGESWVFKCPGSVSR